MYNQMAIFSYPACMKKGGLSSLDQNRSPRGSTTLGCEW